VGFVASLWDVAVQTACYIYNRTPHSAIDFVTPFVMFFKKEPDLGNVTIFGSRIYSNDLNVPKGCKFQYLGYDPKTLELEEICNMKIDESVLYKDDFPNKYWYFIVENEGIYK